MNCIKARCSGTMKVVRTYSGSEWKTQELRCMECGSRRTSLTTYVKDNVSARALAIKEEQRCVKKRKRT